MILACGKSKHESSNTWKLLPFIENFFRLSDEVLQFSVRQKVQYFANNFFLD
jgi:hypothetical protein